MLHDRPYNVLFLCTGNSARSIIAETLLNQVDRRRFRAFSAGSQPKGAIHPMALRILTQAGMPADGLRSKSWDEFALPDAPAMDFVFTVCDDAADETCPVWPGKPMTAHWGVPDPAKAAGSEADIALAFAQTLGMLDARISVFTSLPIAKLDRLSLQAKLHRIGAMERPDRKTPAAA